MKQKTIIAFAVFASLLVVSATPAAAASAELAVGSQFTNDTEFSNAQKLTNTTVERTGDAASVALVSSELGAAATLTFDGTSDYSNKRGIRIQPKQELAGVNIDVGPSTNATRAYVYNATSGNLVVSTGISGGTASLDATLKANQNYSVVVDDDGSTYTTDRNFSFAGPVSTSDFEILGGASGSSAFFSSNIYAIENVTAKTKVAGTGEYVSANHSVNKVEEFTANVTLENASVTVRTEYWDGSQWEVANSSTYTSTANHTLSIPDISSSKWRTNISFSSSDADYTAKLHDESYLFDAKAPDISNVKPPDETYVGESETLSADISDPDFNTAQNDSVTVEFLIDGSVVGSETVTSNGTASTTWSPSTAGAHDYTVRATDSYGDTTTSATRTLNVANELTIRNESNPSEVLTDINGSAEVTFYGSDTIEKRSITNGTVNMTGLPADETFTAVVQADGFYDRRVIIDSLLEQQNIFMLNKTGTQSVEVRFTNDDTTGNFPPESSSVYVEKAITINNTTKWRTLVADEFGVSGVTTNLEKNSRYRLKVKNQEGDTRVLGSYTASNSETVPLQPVSLGVNIKNTSSFYWTADYVNDSAGERLVVQFADPENKTENLEIAIYQQGNRSNKLTPNQTFDGPLGNVSISEPLTENESNVTWVVEMSADRDGEKIGGTQVVGQKIVEQIPGMPDWLQQAAAVVFIIMTGALFSKLNHATGAVVTGLVAGGFWVSGWLPANAGPAVVVALGVAVIYKVGTSSSAGGI